MSSLLETINDPADLRRLARPQLKPLADELRAFVLDSVSKTGGHLSSNLGTVELASCGTWVTRPIRTRSSPDGASA